MEKTIPALRQLIDQGETKKEHLTRLQSGVECGLWAISEDRAVATSTLVQLWSSLPDAEEAVGAVTACESTYRSPWLRILAARLREMGRRRAISELCRMIDTLQEASGAVRDNLPRASLEPTNYGPLEQNLFGTSAEQAQAVPRLLRAIGATAALVEGERGHPAKEIPDVDALDPPQSWRQGRLLRLPDADGVAPSPSSSVLTGSLAELATHERKEDDPAPVAAMRWVLHRPWAMLLAQIVFTQEAWDAERITGGLILELPEGQLSQFHHPLRVDVVVTTADGQEVVCGSLGELLLRMLSMLGITLLAPQRQWPELDERLGSVIERLLEKRVWRFDERAGSVEKTGYIIHDRFSSSCYRIFGSKYFYRQGALLAHAVRRTCGIWAQERLTVSHSAPRQQEALNAK